MMFLFVTGKKSFESFLEENILRKKWGSYCTASAVALYARLTKAGSEIRHKELTSRELQNVAVIITSKPFETKQTDVEILI